MSEMINEIRLDNPDYKIKEDGKLLVYCYAHEVDKDLVRSFYNIIKEEQGLAEITEEQKNTVHYKYAIKCLGKTEEGKHIFDGNHISIGCLNITINTITDFIENDNS